MCLVSDSVEGGLCVSCEHVWRRGIQVCCPQVLAGRPCADGLPYRAIICHYQLYAIPMPEILKSSWQNIPASRNDHSRLAKMRIDQTLFCYCKQQMIEGYLWPPFDGQGWQQVP